MPIILAIETALQTCSIALTQDNKLLDLIEVDGRYIHAEKITVFINETLSHSSKNIKDIGLICVSKGPGSYTGLRIGVSVAKGLAYGLDVPLVSVSTLEGLTVGAILHKKDKGALYCPMIDARRMEVYTCLYNAECQIVQEVSAKVVDENSFAELLSSNKIYFFGDGMEKCRLMLEKHTNAHFIDNIKSSAAYLVPAAIKLFEARKFENLLTFEPYYLKDFFTTAKTG